MPTKTRLRKRATKQNSRSPTHEPAPQPATKRRLRKRTTKQNSRVPTHEPAPQPAPQPARQPREREQYIEPKNNSNSPMGHDKNEISDLLVLQRIKKHGIQ